jgi:uncharacterized protein (DUF885 family)
MPGGDKLYAHLVRVNTTTDLNPSRSIGSARHVKSIHAEMEKVKAQVGFKGTLLQFFEHIRTDAKFKPKSRRR